MPESYKWPCIAILALTSSFCASGCPSCVSIQRDAWQNLAVDSSQHLLSDTKVNKTRGFSPADEWRDLFPFQPQSPWDISTSFRHPRRLEYTVTEGTWLRLDVHPISGDIVFDMLGDLYCLPAGIPYDADPHFSPQGDKLVFRSDAGLGLESIWIMPWTSCNDMDVVRNRAAWVDLEQDRMFLAQGVTETLVSQRRRLEREGRIAAQRVTNETFHWITDPRFHPSGRSIVATKWYTANPTLAGSEAWEYQLPPLSSNALISAGSGKRVVGRVHPAGWSLEQHNDNEIGPEQAIWYGEDSLIYAKNVVDTHTWSEGKDVHKGIYAILQTNLTTGTTFTLVEALPGGASRPELSRDQRTLAFVRRVRDKGTLVLKDLKTGTISYAWDGLDHDVSPSWAPMGTYPSFAFTPSANAIIIWAAGQIYRVPLTFNAQGERVRSGAAKPTPILFSARIELDVADTRKEEFNLVSSESAELQRVYAFKELDVDEIGSRVVFQAAGKIYWKDVGPQAQAMPVPTLEDAPYTSPSFVPDSNGSQIIHARWHDVEFTTFEIANIDNGKRTRLAWLKEKGDKLTGAIKATAKPGLYIGEVTVPEAWNWDTPIQITNPRYIPIPLNVGLGEVVSMKWVRDGRSLLINRATRALLVNTHNNSWREIAKGCISSEVAIPRVNGKNAAFVDLKDVYVAPLQERRELFSKPGNATELLAKVSIHGGHDIAWSDTGDKLFWFLGPTLHHLKVSDLERCRAEIREDPIHFGISCVKNLVKSEKIIVEHTSDIERLKKDANGTATFILHNATLLTMLDGKSPIEEGIVVIKDGVILNVTTKDGVESDFLSHYARNGSKLMDLEGGYVIPGFIDMHAHWYGTFGLSRFPVKSWELETFLAYGVTTVHNPSAHNVNAFWERSRLERGQFVGPRVFSVGNVLFGAKGMFGAQGSIYQDIADMDEAFNALIRIKAEGGPAAISYKNYNLPFRASRQRLLTAAREMKMLCVPEGGMYYDWDITYIIDGMTTVEHNLPVPRLYEDVQILFAQSGTGNTPTHLVHYGGPPGEEYVWAKYDLPNDAKLRTFIPHEILETLTETTSRPKNSWSVFNASSSVASMVRRGMKTHIGAHGEPPLGFNFHSEMAFAKAGGLSNLEVIQAATADAATTLGLSSSIGSIARGRLADLVIYPPGVDLLAGDISETRKLQYVMRGGRLWNATSMEQVWPLKVPRQVMPPLNAD